MLNFLLHVLTKNKTDDKITIATRHIIWRVFCF